MKKKAILLVSLLCLIGYVFFACQDEGIPPEESDITTSSWLTGIDQAELKRAQEWYEKHESEIYSSSRASVGKHPLFVSMKPFWQEAFGQQMRDSLKTVEIPLETFKRTLFPTAENAEMYEITKDPGYLITSLRLVLLTDIKNGSDFGFFMVIVPSENPMSSTRVNPTANTYLDKKNDFNGYIYYYALNGDYINGWKMENGKATHTVSRTSLIKESLSRSGGYYHCETKCAPRYQEVCTTYTSYAEAGGQVYPQPNHTKCEIEYLGQTCYEECTYVPEEGGEDGGGVINPKDTTEIKRCPVCKQPLESCICPKRIDCDEQAVKNSTNAEILLATMNECDMQNIFVSQYMNASVEHGFSIMFDPTTKTYSTDITTDNEVDNVSIPFGYGVPFTVTYIHNHPRSNPPSAQDIFTLAKVNNLSHGSIKSAFVLAKNGRYYNLQIVDTKKATQFYQKYLNPSTSKIDSITAVALDTKISEIHARILSEVGYDDVNTELSHKAFALANFLENEDTGMVLLAKDGQENFKQFFAHDSAYIDEQGFEVTIIIRAKCK